MFEQLLAKKYIFRQKRHSILTICSIAAALALMTALFMLFSTLLSCMHDIIYDNAPYHYKITNLTKDKAESLLNLPEFDCNMMIEKDYTCSVELLLKDYTEYDYFADIENYWEPLEIDPKKQLEVNRMLITLDLKDLSARAEFAQIFAVFYIFVIFLALLLRLVIDTAFEISSKEREKQFGVLQSIGATPQQIVKMITFEGLMLSCIGVPIGSLIGMGLGYGAFQAILSSGVAEAYLHDGQESLLHYHINLILLLTAMITGLAWVLFSAYGTGMRVIKMTPVQAISGRSSQIMKVKKFSLFGLLFGWKGRLASRNNRRQPKRFIITVLSLVLSMVLFASTSIIIEKAGMVTDRMLDDMYGEFLFDLMVPTKETAGADGYLDTVEKVEESPYFTNICADISVTGVNEDENKKLIFINYVNENQYLQDFNNNPPVSYQELKNSGSYLYASEIPLEDDTLTVEKIISYGSDNAKTEEQNFTYPIMQKTGIPDSEKKYLSGSTERYIWLYASVDLYRNSAKELYHLSRYYGDFSAVLTDTKDHDKALDFLKSLDTVAADQIMDIYEIHHQEETMLSAVRIGLNCMNIMFMLIALINMINIISTGIINRKAEIASLQSLGMAENQLYGITILECSQYALTAGVISIILTEILFFLTARFLKLFEVFDGDGSVLVSMDDIINYAEPVPRLLLAVGFALVTAMISSLIPLRIMQKSALTDRMHSVD
ncbi:MAG: FtsX-like permease family protein [Oscillospiraceae bacterium]|nr:FtsX-like permease family protein [Oscillospiraceae bacterium]